MPRHTHGEIEKAKMLARNVSRFQNAQCPPLSRFIAATALLFKVVRTVIWQRLMVLSRWLRDVQVCPCCEGTGMPKANDPYSLGCRLCKEGEVNWREAEAYRYGQAVLRYRQQHDISESQMYYLCGLAPSHVIHFERGLTPTDDWPDSLYDIAVRQLESERTH